MEVGMFPLRSLDDIQHKQFSAFMFNRIFVWIAFSTTLILLILRYKSKKSDESYDRVKKQSFLHKNYSLSNYVVSALL